MQSILQQKIKEHYDVVSPYYQRLWGNHLHHGYYVTGKESKSVATENLIRYLISKIELPSQARVLDVGCGIGGSSLWLAQHHACNVTGITISTTQIEAAQALARQLPSKILQPTFLLMDAQQITIKEKFDLIWAVEMISHLEKKEALFKKSTTLLKKGGYICIADWFMKDKLSPSDKKKYITPIEEGMFVQLETME